MGHENRDQGRDDGQLYRVEVRGHLPRSRWSWFGAEAVALHGPTTILHLRVVDQSDLYGRLRKIHDLNLQLVSVQEVEGERSRKAGEKLQWLETDPPTTSGT